MDVSPKKVVRKAKGKSAPPKNRSASMNTLKALMVDKKKSSKRKLDDESSASDEEEVPNSSAELSSPPPENKRRRIMKISSGSEASFDGKLNFNF